MDSSECGTASWWACSSGNLSQESFRHRAKVSSSYFPVTRLYDQVNAVRPYARHFAALQFWRPVSCRTSSGDHVPITFPCRTWGFGSSFDRLPSRPHRNFGDSVLTPWSFAFVILWVIIPPVGLGLPVLNALHLG